jgi:hypothetical protein
MTEMTLFGGNSLVSADLLKSLQDMNTNLAGSVGAGGNRISIRGMRFRQYAGGEQVAVSKDDAMNIVILNAARISRTYYEGTYDPDTPAAPSCWSADTQAPAPEVPAEQRMSDKCATCPMNIKGSASSGAGRACRFNQRLAVAIEGELDKVYQLQLPATSIFGEAKGTQMGMQAYARYLQAHNTPAIAVVTQMSFDTNAETPKLFFKPVRPLAENELRVAIEAKDSPEAIKAITLTVAQTDGVKKAEPKGSKPYNPYKEKIEIEEAPKPKAKAKPVEVEEEIEEPVKVVKKIAPKAQVADNDLASIVDEWDD